LFYRTLVFSKEGKKMQPQRFWRVNPAAAIALAGMITIGTNAARAAADLRPYISPDFCAAVVIHPEQIAKSPLAEAAKSAAPQQAASGDPFAAAFAALKMLRNLPTGMDVDKLSKLLQGKKAHRIVVLVDPMTVKNQPGWGVILQFSDDIDGDAILAAIATDQQPAETNGVKYAKFTVKPGNTDLAAAAPDTRTFIFGTEGAVVKMLAKNEGERPLVKQLQQASLKHDILVEVCAEPMWAGLTKSMGKSQDELLAGAPVAAMSGVVKDLKSLSLRLNFSGKSLLHGELASGKSETVAMLATLGKSQVDGVKQLFEASKQQPPPGVKQSELGMVLKMMPSLSKLGDEIFAGLAIKSEGPLLTVELPTPDSLPDVLKAAGQMGAGMMRPPAPAAAR
jgi:hypothetical protein